MAVTSQTPSIAYTGNGSTTEFAFNFVVPATDTTGTITSSTGGITSGTTALVVTDANFFYTSDLQGKAITITGAGPSSATLETTITNVVSGTQVTLGTAASSTVSGQTVTVTTGNFNTTLATNSDIKVFEGGALKSISSDYTVLLNVGDDSNKSGKVIFNTAPTNGTAVVITRDVTLQRTTDFQTGGALTAKTLNAQFDNMVMAVQDTQFDTAASAIKFPTDESVTTTFVSNVAGRSNKVLGFDGSGEIQMVNDVTNGTSAITGTTVKGTTSLQTPLIEFTDGDDAISIANGGAVTISQSLTANSVDINGGAIDNVTIGGSTPGSATFDTAVVNSGFGASGLTYPTSDGSAGHVMVTDGSGNLSFTALGGLNIFTGLTDTPNNYTGAAGKYLKVNASANALEYDTLTSDDATQGSNNVYFSTSGAAVNTTNLTEGNNLYYTQARFDTAFGNKTTNDLTENTNLYYTDARADARIANNIIDEDNFATDSNSRAPSQQSVKAYIATQIATKDNSDEITEGSTNLYYTDARARASISIYNSSQLSWNGNTGQLTFTQGNTDTVAEGSSNLYFTDARADARVTAGFTAKSTSDLSEGTNLYYTDARAQAVSINNVSEDTTPQLGGNLDVNGNNIVAVSNGSINIDAKTGGTGKVYIKGDHAYSSDPEYQPESGVQILDQGLKVSGSAYSDIGIFTRASQSVGNYSLEVSHDYGSTSLAEGNAAGSFGFAAYSETNGYVYPGFVSGIVGESTDFSDPWTNVTNNAVQIHTSDNAGKTNGNSTVAAEFREGRTKFMDDKLRLNLSGSRVSVDANRDGDELRFTTKANGNIGLRPNGSGKVGVNTSSPSATLDVSGSFKTTSFDSSVVLNMLGNVSTASPNNGQFLQYNTSSGAWEPADVGVVATLAANLDTGGRYRLQNQDRGITHSGSVNSDGYLDVTIDPSDGSGGTHKVQNLALSSAHHVSDTLPTEGGVTGSPTQTVRSHFTGSTQFDRTSYFQINLENLENWVTGFKDNSEIRDDQYRNHLNGRAGIVFGSSLDQNLTNGDRAQSNSDLARARPTLKFQNRGVVNKSDGSFTYLDSNNNNTQTTTVINPGTSLSLNQFGYGGAITTEHVDSNPSIYGTGDGGIASQGHAGISKHSQSVSVPNANDMIVGAWPVGDQFETTLNAYNNSVLGDVVIQVGGKHNDTVVAAGASDGMGLKEKKHHTDQVRNTYKIEDAVRFESLYTGTLSEQTFTFNQNVTLQVDDYLVQQTSGATARVKAAVTGANQCVVYNVTGTWNTSNSVDLNRYGTVTTAIAVPTNLGSASAGITNGGARATFGIPITFANKTTTERDALTAAEGMMLYNSTTNQMEVYGGGSPAWSSIGGGANLSSVGEHILPATDNTYDLGSSSKQFRNIYGGGANLSSVVVGTYANPPTSDNFCTLTSSGIIQSGRTGTGNQPMLEFFNGNGVVGSIYTNGSSTSFNTSSDYRLKENVVAMTDATTRLKQLTPKRFNFTASADTTLDGFLAHEVQTVVPEAVTGAKDAVNDDGTIIPQGIDQSKLVPLLVKTIQELEQRITDLENGQ